MSNKAWKDLNELDRMLRTAKPVTGFTMDHTKVHIEMINGFELFNTRPYHNYETWSDGYRVYDDHIVVEAEDLDDAIKLYCTRLTEFREKEKARQEKLKEMAQNE